MEAGELKRGVITHTAGAERGGAVGAGLAGAWPRAVPAFALFALSVIFITLPLFFERLHSDEVIYWDVARNIAAGAGVTSETLGGVFFWHAPLPFFIVAPFLKLSEHIFLARALSSLFTAGCAVLVFLIAERKASRAEAALSAVLFVFSFQALRYGGRFYLDQYGAFFFLLALYLLGAGRVFAAGVSAVLMCAAREYWLGVYPFMLLYAALDKRRGSASAFAAPMVVTALALAAALAAYGALPRAWAFASGGAIARNVYASLTAHTAGGLLSSLARGWTEFAALNAVVIAGFIAWTITTGPRRYLLLALPQVLLISLVHGFIVDGGATQYPLALVAALAPFSGPGLARLWGRLPLRGLTGRRFVPAAIAVVAVQYAALNVLATTVSLHQNSGVYGLGYGPDREVIGKLRREARGDFIHGIHGAFVPDRSRWDWTDYYFADAIEKDPDWLVAYSNYLEVLPHDRWKGRAEVEVIGPYTVVHSLERGGVARAVAAAGPKGDG
ncbi:MAG: ArnT family glycosyltransferase [Thermodesulfobacteriota bacterium]